MQDYDTYRLPSGELAFRLSWPHETVNGVPLHDQIWRQNSSPVELPKDKAKIEQSACVHDRVSYLGTRERRFHGIGRADPNGSEDYQTGHSLLHGQPGTGWFWFTVGAPKGFFDGGTAFPGPYDEDSGCNAHVKHVELYVWRPHGA